ncbi:MAG: response regulator [Deltaproteobacteria bacterium]|jgi:CheY-like chemotaxis protein|nr:response regulator [Deltaproteobacteria bacterium]
MGKSMEMTPLSDAGLLGSCVLVADDVPQSRWSYVGLLRGAGARVTEARDGFEALALARADRPDLILADMAMPRLDGLGLCAALREEPALEGVPVVLLSDGEPPQAVWGGDGASHPLIDAVMAALEAHAGGSARLPAVGPMTPSSELTLEQAREVLVDHAERENIRAQSTVAMYREPANHAGRAAPGVWRSPGTAEPEADGSASGFGAELRVMSRILGLGFLTLAAATIALIAWRIAMTTDRVPGPTALEEPGSAGRESEVPAPAAPLPAPRSGVSAFSGELRFELDRSLGLLAGQGVLELDGPREVRVSIDGEDSGTLPVSLPLDEGVHRVRYRFEDGVTDRFYYVKSGATRRLVIITRRGGFVDAR